MIGQDSPITTKEKLIQHALGTMFVCVGCDKLLVMSQISTGGVYMIDNFCLKCLKTKLLLLD